MAIPRKYIHDKLMLLLASSNIFLAFLSGALILLRISSGDGAEGYIVEYRSNLGIGAFTSGTVADMFSFAAFALLVAALAVVLSINVYRVRRMLSILVLILGIVLLLMTVIVSNALLALR